MINVATVGCLLLLFNNVCCKTTDEEEWVDPHAAWSGLAMDYGQPENCQCPAAPERSPVAIEDALALTYFKKFTTLLFQRKRLEFDAASALYKRSLLFKLLPSELDELESVQDPRDLDVLLGKILDRAETAPLFRGKLGCSYTQKSGVLALVTDIFKDIIALSKISEVKFFLVVTMAILLGYIVHRRFGFRIISIIIGACFLTGYFYTYMECNRKLEVESMLEVIDSQSGSYGAMSWFGKLKSLVYSDSATEKRKEMLRKSSKISISYCLPDQVFLMYMNDLFFKQLEILLERVTHTMTRLSTNLGWPYCYIAPLFLIALVGYIIKLTFKYILSPKAWGSLLHRSGSHPASNATIPSIAAKEPGVDCISGDNLKMLLNVMTATSVPQPQMKQLPGVSGVQEVMEPLEAPPPSTAEKKESLDVSDSSTKSQSSNKSQSSIQEEGFTLVDDTEDI
ncbi:hypothetical protein KR074_001658 [Drosophila pseudoananassae]|nr:hypothetical protein KR074_001658 [Drosophila pseudoananassae]